MYMCAVPVYIYIVFSIMIDNLPLIKPLLHRDNNDEFYFIQVIARKKDIEWMEGNNRVIKDYYVYSTEYLDKVYPEIQKLCKLFKARAYIRLSRRNATDIAKDLIVLLGEAFKNNNFQHLKKLYSTAVGQSLWLDKLWILDIDFDKNNTNLPYDKPLRDLRKLLTYLLPEGEKIITTLSTPNGLHVICKPFNLLAFRELDKYKDIDVHKNNPTILYAI